jgi:hypothetical protein
MGIRDLIKTEYLIEEKIQKKYETSLESNVGLKEEVNEELLT